MNSCVWHLYSRFQILTGHASVGLVGGAENMSQAPHSVYSMRWGQKFGTDTQFLDTLWAGLSDSYCNLPMGITAENLAEQYGLSREECDAYAVQSQTRYATALANGTCAPCRFGACCSFIHWCPVLRTQACTSRK